MEILYRGGWIVEYTYTDTDTTFARLSEVCARDGFLIDIEQRGHDPFTRRAWYGLYRYVH